MFIERVLTICDRAMGEMAEKNSNITLENMAMTDPDSKTPMGATEDVNNTATS